MNFALVAALDQQEVDYALCGGMAMAIHGRLRSTVDIDLLSPSAVLDEVLAIANSLGSKLRGSEQDLADISALESEEDEAG